MYVMTTLAASAMIAGWISRAADRPAAVEPPYGIPTRVAWTTSRVAGSPEAPPPFQTRRAFANLTFQAPLDITFDGKRVYILEQKGKIFSFPNDEKCAKPDQIIDLSRLPGLSKIPGCTGIGDAYGIALHPQFAKNHFLYACYILSYNDPARNHAKGSRISRFTVNELDPPTIDPKSEVVLLESPSGGHDGGCVKFGPDGDLYISLGDGGEPEPPDPFNTGQDISDLMSSILRIDVDHPSEGKPYSIPADNPFVKTPGARPEVFAYGLRNPWRMSFDRKTGLLWVGDVGWELWESVVCAKAGGNYGWSIMEGPNPVHPDGKRGPTPITPPQIALSHSEAASLTGGVVYHGDQFPELKGHYLFGDWQTQRLWAAKCNGDTLEPHRTIAMTDQRIVAFGEEPNGELLIVDHQGGGLWRIARNDAPKQSQNFPRKLSETGLFSSTKDQTPQTGVIPFSVNASQWVDGAFTQRWVAVPGTERVALGKGVWGDDKQAWPKNSVLARTFSLETRPGVPATRRHVETQILHFDGKQWQGYSYAWNDAQTDAELVDAKGDEKPIPIQDPMMPTGVRQQLWRFGSRAQCMTCHNPWTDYTLAFTPAQLDRPARFGEVTDNQARTFRHIGLLLEPKPPQPPNAAGEKLTLTNPYDLSGDLNERARSYLDVNCSHCHRYGGGGTAQFDVRKELPLEKVKLLNARPNLGGFDLDDPQLICGGDPSRSVLLFRMAKVGRGRMPHIGSDRVDDKGVNLIRQWAMSLPPRAGASPLNPAASKASMMRTGALQFLEDPKASPADTAATADRLLSSTSGALALLGKVLDGKLPAATLQMATMKGAASPHEPIRDLFRRFDPADQSVNRLGPNIDPAKLLALHGDPEKGRKIFAEQGGTGLCVRCHIVSGKGTDFGPDLTHIAAKYNRADLLDNILNPSKTIAQGYATYVLKTKSGEVYTGFLLSRTDAEVVLKDATLKQIRVPASDVQQLTAQTVSAMPDGMLGDLEAHQAADLLEYLTTLK